MSNPTFLIVTPSYNQAQFIEETLASVVSQDVDMQFVVFDGGSTDTTVDILKKNNQKRLTWFSEADNGQTNAINKGIHFFKNLSKEKQENAIFAYLNSDDYYLPESLKKVSQVFKDNPEINWLVGEAVIKSEKHAFFHGILVKVWKRVLKICYFSNLLLILNPIPQPATFLRWSVIQKIGDFNEGLKYVMDYEYWLRVQKVFGKPNFINEPLAVFRIHNLSKGGSQFLAQFNEQERVARSFTKNTLFLSLHSLHNRITLLLYAVFKS